jgi:uncharacterized RDD family membrane protein YckC
MSEAYLIPASSLPARPGYLTRRCVAFGIDMLLASAAGWVLLIGILIFGILTLGLGFLMLHVLPLVPLLYFTLFIATGATPGQRLCGIAVRQDSGAVPNLAQALVFTLLLGVSLALAGLPLLLALAGPRHRAAHDLLSGLMVTRPGY